MKQQLTSQLLVHFDPQKKLLSCDASLYGIGAVLYVMEEGSEKQIVYASRTSVPAEKSMQR